jgi:hypothetical protein
MSSHFIVRPHFTLISHVDTNIYQCHFHLPDRYLSSSTSFAYRQSFSQLNHGTRNTNEAASSIVAHSPVVWSAISALKSCRWRIRKRRIQSEQAYTSATPKTICSIHARKGQSQTTSTEWQTHYSVSTSSVIQNFC